MHQTKSFSEIVTGIGASDVGHPKLIVYFSTNSDEESRKVVIYQIVKRMMMIMRY